MLGDLRRDVGIAADAGHHVGGEGGQLLYADDMDRLGNGLRLGRFVSHSASSLDPGRSAERSPAAARR